MRKQSDPAFSKKRKPADSRNQLLKQFPHEKKSQVHWHRQLLLYNLNHKGIVKVYWWNQENSETISKDQNNCKKRTIPAEKFDSHRVGWPHRRCFDFRQHRDGISFKTIKKCFCGSVSLHLHSHWETIERRRKITFMPIDDHCISPIARNLSHSIAHNCVVWVGAQWA